MVTQQRRRIILNYPPASSVWHIPAGIALLTSMLRAQSHEVIQRYGHIIGLEEVLRQHGGEEVEKALQIIRDPKSKILDWYAARKTFERVSAEITTEETKDHFSVKRNNVLYVSEHYDGTIDGLLRALGKREENIFYGYFSGTEIPLAKAMNPDVYAIGIADERQLIPGMILASLVKDELPQTKVIVGGNFWSRVKSAFAHPDFAKLFEHFDAVVYREGFQPMMEFAETLNPESASGTVWKDGNIVKINPPTSRPTAFETLPVPAMDGGARQWSPDMVPSLYTMSNCLMQCGFCAISAGSDTFLQTPRMMSPEKIAETMSQLGEKRFDIFDETFPINRQLALGQELKKKGYEATWNCYLTITKDLFDPKRAQELYQAGCRGVQLGLETLSRDTLLREAKSWNHPETYGAILKNLADAGIQTHIFLITGLPGEPLHSSLRWLPFIEDFGEHILTIKAGRYRLTRNSPDAAIVEQNPYLVPHPDDKPLHLNRDFHYKKAGMGNETKDESMSMKRIDAVRDILEQACREHWAFRVTSTLPWWVNRGRYSLGELREMAGELAKSCPPEPQIPHLEKALVKANSIISEATGKNYGNRSFEDLQGVAREL